ncbi:MAG: ArsA family ATPase [Syntrophobacterales bacterium]|nr:ArsA family ATPase [Syntrophobacterales bacterium]
MVSFLKDPSLQLLLFGGKGGVGKTTCAVATALRLARAFPHQTFLIVSTDPAHSLNDSLAGLSLPANLTSQELDAQALLKAFRDRHRDKLREIAARGTFLDNQDINRFLDLSLPGLDELMGLLEIAGWVEQHSYDCIIVDTAPTGHTLRLLTVPELLQGWLRALDTLLAKHRFLIKRFQGSYQRDELDNFILDLAAASRRMEKLLRDPKRCLFVPVALAEKMVIAETLALLSQLERMRVPVRDLVVNRLYPLNGCPVCQEGRQRQTETLEEFCRNPRLVKYRFWGVPFYPEEMRGQVVTRFWDGIRSLPEPAPAPLTQQPELRPHVEAPPPCPSPALSLLIFAGKGGVGKTTLACATAVRLAHDFPDKEIFLFSSDPAHSLSACLKTPVGPAPVRIAPGLTALEIDAVRAFASWKAHYQREIGPALQFLFPQFDLPFDRQVMERLLDLAPPGLDEIMALTQAMDFLESGRYDVFVLDSAPTGHLLRLLELPELIDQWLKGLFGVLLKYNLTFRLPHFSQQLVRMSKELKLLRARWRDPNRTALYAVSILTEMALEETKDLAAACERLKINVPVIFLNQATPPSATCPWCAAMHRQELRLKARYLQEFDNRHLTTVYRQHEPRGLEPLAELGQALFRVAMKESPHGVTVDMPALPG